MSRRRFVLGAAPMACAGLFALAALYRNAYGAWPPSAPDRIEHCGRRFYRGGDASTVTPAGMELRSIGRIPPVVGARAFQERRRGDTRRCTLGTVLRQTGNGDYEQYLLSGGP
jgi:hypothetical protein